MDELLQALQRLRDRREYALRADSDEEIARENVAEAALDLLEAMAARLIRMAGVTL